MYYRLDENKQPVAVNPGQSEWKRVAYDEIGDSNTYVSTVFEGIKHGVCKETNKPYLFETMVFIDGESSFRKPYTSWEDAEKGHQEIVRSLEIQQDGN